MSASKIAEVDPEVIRQALVRCGLVSGIHSSVTDRVVKRMTSYINDPQQKEDPPDPKIEALRSVIEALNKSMSIFKILADREGHRIRRQDFEMIENAWHSCERAILKLSELANE
jgi:hypothetical protein